MTIVDVAKELEKDPLKTFNRKRYAHRPNNAIGSGCGDLIGVMWARDPSEFAKFFAEDLAADDWEEVKAETGN
jgi:catalase (peroxidase I)